MKIGVKIFVLFASFMFIGSSAAMHSFYLGSEDVLKKEVYAHLETAAQSKANHVEMFLHEHKQAVLTLSDDIVFRELLTTKGDKSNPNYEEKFERANKQLNSIVAINDEFNEMFVLDSDGKIVATSHILEEIGADFSGDVYFLEGENALYVRDAYYDEDLKENSVGMSAPIRNEKTGEVKGVLVAEISLKELAEITLDRTGLGETGEIYLVNKDGYMITPSRFIPEKMTFLKQKVDTTNSRECLEHYEEHYIPELGKIKEHENIVKQFLDYRGKNVIGTHAYIPEMQWCLLAEIDEAEALGQLRIELIKSALMSLSIMVFFIFLAEYIIRGIVKQIYVGKDRK